MVYLKRDNIKIEVDGVLSKFIDIPKRVNKLFLDSLLYVLEGKISKAISAGLAKDKVTFKII